MQMSEIYVVEAASAASDPRPTRPSQPPVASTMQYKDHTETAAPEACPYAVLGLGQRASLAEIKKA